MLKTILIMLFLNSYLFSLELNNQTTYNELLSKSEIYIDNNKSETIKTIQKKKFIKTNKVLLGCGYSPKYAVWIRFTLTNRTNHTIEKIIEYDNPLTSYVEFFEDGVLKKEDGLLNLSKHRYYLNPTLKVTLKPYQSKTFYIRAYSKITTLIVKLNLWSPNEFIAKDMSSKVMLALFFGAVFIVILYNLFIFILTKELNYLLFSLFFLSVSFHHFMYKGLAKLYFSTQIIEALISYSSCIVALPIFFLALFTQRLLNLKNYPKLNKLLIYIGLLYVSNIVIIWYTELYSYRSVFMVITLFYLFLVTTYLFFKKNKKAPLLFFSWLVVISSAIFMYLSSLGVYDIFTHYPYYTEAVLGVGIVAFSFKAITAKLKAMEQERKSAKKSELMLKEYKHRVANQNQNILNFLSIHQHYLQDRELQEFFKSLEHRVMVTIEVFSQLENTTTNKIVNTYNYFSLITEKLKESFDANHVTISIESDVFMNAKDTTTCCYIVNEAVCNAFKYAFRGLPSGEIKISLKETKEEYTLKIKDNGEGFKNKRENGIGLEIIKKLATLQLDGSLKIEQKRGVMLEIKWSKDEK